MSRCIFLIVYLMAGTLSSLGQGLDLKHLSWWNPEYPTVVDAGVVSMRSGEEDNKFGYPSESQIESIKKIPGMEDFTIVANSWETYLFSTLKAVDDIDYKLLSEEQKSQILNNLDGHTFLWEMPNGRTRTTNGIPFNKYDFIQTLNIDFKNSNDKPELIEQYYQKDYEYNVLVDWDVDWSKIRTYDFILRGSDPLTDKKILEEFVNSLVPSLTRDTSSPDVFITIAKDSESSVSYSYVPPKVDYVKTGSTTRKVYNWVGLDPRYNTEDHYERIESKGYTQEINHSEVFLEICMLDASRIEQSTPPVIYKATVNKSFPKKIDILEYYLGYARKFNHPINQKFALKELRYDKKIPHTLRWGMKTSKGGDCNVSKSNPDEVLMIYRPSLGYINGVLPQVGDKIIKRDMKYNRWNNNFITEKLKYKDASGKTHKVELEHIKKRGIPLYWSGDYWFCPYLLTIEE